MSSKNLRIKTEKNPTPNSALGVYNTVESDTVFDAQFWSQDFDSQLQSEIIGFLKL